MLHKRQERGFCCLFGLRIFVNIHWLLNLDKL